MSDYCGAVMQPVDPNNLEPEEHHEYQDEPARTPDILVQCYKPFNGEEVDWPILKGRHVWIEREDAAGGGCSDRSSDTYDCRAFETHESHALAIAKG